MGWQKRMNAHLSRNVGLMSQPLIILVGPAFKDQHAAGNKIELPVKKWMSMNESVT